MITRKGLTYSRVAKLLQLKGMKVNAFHVANVVRGFTKRPDVRRGIAEILGADPHTLWPDLPDDEQQVA